jgi:hypothetical protein
MPMQSVMEIAWNPFLFGTGLAKVTLHWADIDPQKI